MSLESKLENLLDRIKLNRFTPFPFARSGFLQTIYGRYWPYLKAPKPNAAHTVLLNDRDAVVLVENRPKTWKNGKRIVLLVHGLCGDQHSNYMERMARRLYHAGNLVLRMNLRTCGPGFGLATKSYHAGISEDARSVLRWIGREFPASPVTQVGFSLGGNITLKLAGEDGSRPTGPLDSVVAVSPPVDLKAAALRMGARENWIFQKVFVNQLKKDVERLHGHVPELGPTKFPDGLTIQMFDEIYTAPQHGFSSADHYYRDASSLPLLPEIKLPTFLVASIDDPVVDVSAVIDSPPNKNVDVLLTEHGGHVGFLGFGTRYDEPRWSDQAVSNWIEKTLAS